MTTKQIQQEDNFNYALTAAYNHGYDRGKEAAFAWTPAAPETRLPDEDETALFYVEWTGTTGKKYNTFVGATLKEIKEYGYKPIAFIRIPPLPEEN